jgi:hypothetical protein
MTEVLELQALDPDEPADLEKGFASTVSLFCSSGK